MSNRLYEPFDKSSMLSMNILVAQSFIDNVSDRQAEIWCSLSIDAGMMKGEWSKPATVETLYMLGRPHVRDYTMRGGGMRR